MNYILDPISLKSVPLNSEDGKLLLKKYIIEYNKMGGKMDKAKPLKDLCHTALYERKAPDENVDTKCDVKSYMNNLKESIEFIKELPRNPSGPHSGRSTSSMRWRCGFAWRRKRCAWHRRRAWRH